ncbi:MAG: NAD(P)H-hydrate dehydratase [Candidatus Omnitrophica bacterium]|nr:NAD(P)H-hydrate dehydratase [Candidatus Omnitrophota bacterium]MBD3268686.1 NAD(P)H-hydrate dehydratase [Candidatus Omnitrophota bacterium]
MRLPAQLLKRKPDTHKGSYGHVLVLGGSPGLTGAVCLCGQAALRSGAGMITAGVPSSLNHIFECKLTEIMSLPLPDRQGYLSSRGFKQAKDFADKADVVVVGGGASCNLSARNFILKVVRHIEKPLIIDADGLNALAGNPDYLMKRASENVIITPHPKEFSRLTKKSVSEIKQNRKELAKKFALRYNLTLVLKGNHTIITNGKSCFENSTGNPGLATAGTGDVLCGIIAGLLVQNLNTLDAARLGVYIHGLAADTAVKDKTQVCLIASDLIEYLPGVFKKFR